jgi:phenylalanyl-tRNA synthetase beta chain
MKISLNWLRQYVDIKETPQEVENLFTMHSAEVEEIKAQGELLDKVVVGKIKVIRKHPNADKLQLVDTEIGNNKIVQIVCGGTNLRQNMLVAVAMVGAKIRWHGEGEPVVLERTKIRGEYSEGMICLDSEIGLGDNVGTEIMDLEKFIGRSDLKAGEALAKILGLDDYIIEIDNKSLTHRSDLFCHTGLAREYAAITNKKLKLPKLPKIKIDSNQYKMDIRVENFNDVSRYMSIVLDNIKIKPSPDWMQRLLNAAGMRPINNIVDITNFLMLEFGHPAHAFDYNKIAGRLFNLRRAKKGEKIITLDDKERNIDQSVLIIEDREKITDLAGIMGGATSEISDDTKVVAFEVADFNKTLIRKTANKLGLRTEAVVRFEKGLGPLLTEQTFLRGVELFKLYADARVASKLYDIKKITPKEKKIKVEIEYVNKLIGLEIPVKKMVSILNSLDLKTRATKKELEVTIPLFRADLNIAEDIIEEIARIYGYDNIPIQSLTGEFKPVEQTPEIKWGNIIAQKLADFGFTEVMNYSFDQNKEASQVQIANPLSEDQKYLRVSLLPNLLNNVRKNLDNNFNDLKLFEIGHVYLKNKEKKMLGIMLVNDHRDIFYKTKGYLEKLLSELNINNEELLNNLKFIEKNIIYAEFDLMELVKSANTNKKFIALSKYPAVEIDLSISLNQKYFWKEIKKEIYSANPLIKKIELFDVYQGEKIGKDNKSLAMHISFQDNTRTLSMKEVENFRDDLMRKLNNKFNAIIRDK